MKAQEILFTQFFDVRAVSKQEFHSTWPDFIAEIENARQYDSKTACPLIKLATFGERRSAFNSLRNDANVIAVCGIEGDYDSEVVTIDEAAEKLVFAGITALFYTSSSHTATAPRWRVLCPLSRDYKPNERRRFVARLNGVLGGILAPESFTLSQSYYFGRVAGAPYATRSVEGRCIDELEELDSIAIDNVPRRGKARGEKAEEARSSDPVIAQLLSRGMVKRARADGGVDIICPFESSHTVPGGESATTYFAAHTSGYAQGHFVCKHSHCAERGDAEFLAAIGMADSLDSPGFKRNKDGRIKATIGNTLRALRRPDICGWRLARDTFRDEIMKAEGMQATWTPLTDDDYTVIRDQLEEMRDAFLPLGLEMVRQCASLAAFENQFDSALQWLNALEWDGAMRVEASLTTYFGAANTPYVRAIGRYLWTALAGRVLLPGVQADMVPVGVGAQGLRKSRTIAAIAPYPDYFAELDLSEDNDNLARLMRGKVIVELAELQGLRNRELEHIKAFISRSQDQWIPKYKEMSATYVRRGVFFGSTNDDEFLSDQTGNRRWLPFDCGYCDSVSMAADRDQLWAEGALLYRDSGIAWQDAERLATHEHAQFVVTDPWDANLSKWLGLERRDAGAPFTLSDALQYGVGLVMPNTKQADQMRLVKILKRFGYSSSGKPESINGAFARYWRKK